MRAIYSILLFVGFVGADVVATPQEAFERLVAGNRRFVNEKLKHPNRTDERRQTLREVQSPFAVIVTCSDSRVVPEVIFDEGLGDLFVIRVAGNVIGKTEQESVLYAVEHLKPEIVVVMGHQNCGAVDAVVEGHDQGIPEIAQLIRPSVKHAREMKKPGDGDLLQRSIEVNAQAMAEDLLKVDLVHQRVQEKRLDVRPAYYDLSTGSVEYLELHH